MCGYLTTTGRLWELEGTWWLQRDMLESDFFKAVMTPGFPATVCLGTCNLGRTGWIEHMQISDRPLGGARARQNQK